MESKHMTDFKMSQIMLDKEGETDGRVHLQYLSPETWHANEGNFGS